jgi:hypothetical protein
MTRWQIYSAGAAVLVALALGVAALRWSGTEAPPPPASSSSDRPFADGPERASFISSSVSSCAREMAAKAPAGQPVSGDAVDAYCRCYSNGMADIITADDVQRMSAGAPPMEVIHDKAVRVLEACQGQPPAK